MLSALQSPAIVDIVQQPPVTPEITYPQVILGAIGVAGLIMVLAAVAGLLAGGIIIYRKKREEAAGTATDTGHARLKLS